MATDQHNALPTLQSISISSNDGIPTRGRVTHTVACSMDRLAQNLADLLNTTKEFQVKGVGVRFLEEPLFLDASESDATMTKVIVSMLGAVAEFERSIIRKRQREGIELAKKRVVYKRRKPTDAVIIEKAREQVNPGTLLAQLVRESGFARSTLYRHL